MVTGVAVPVQVGFGNNGSRDMLFVDQWNWSVPYLSAISDAPVGLCRLNQVSLGCDRRLSRGNTVGHETQFGIIWKAALYGERGCKSMNGINRNYS